MSGSSNSLPRSNLSLYANLLDSDVKSSSESIAKGPVAVKSTLSSLEPKKPLIDAATLRFQPTKRPQLPQKSKPKSTLPKSSSIEGLGLGNSTAQSTPLPTASNSAKIVKTSIADWTVDRDDDTFYGTEKRQRGGRKKKRRNKEHVLAQDWDDIYDPNRPNNFEEYKNSDEKLREIREWKDRLYAHRETKKTLNQNNSEEEAAQSRSGHTYAPPKNYDFAPPVREDSPKLPDQTYQEPSNSPNKPSLPVNPPASSNSPSVLSTSITRAPVNYNLPAGDDNNCNFEKESEKDPSHGKEEDISKNEENTSRSRRPGQKKFAERFMTKYGWSKGKGLGAEESGLINPLQVKLEKRKKRSDAEGGGFRDAGNRGKIIGGKQNSSTEKNQSIGKFGPISEVILLDGMVDGADLEEESRRGGDGELMQEIGDECSEKYGRVERVYIHRTGATARVFVNFTSQLSALRAVNALEGRIFNGKTITAQFFDSSRFEAGIYE